MSNCPYGCQNGFVLIEATGMRVACPHCRGTAKYLNTVKNEDSQSFTSSVFDVLKIPIQYRNISPYTPYSVIEQIRNYPNGGADAEEVSNVLNNIIQYVEKNSVYRMSCYINVPSAIDINSFVYGVQLQALIHEIGTMPFISLNTLNALLHGEVINDLMTDLSDTSPVTDGRTGKTVPMKRRLRDITGFDYVDYINSPLIFLDATSGTTSAGWTAVADLLAERAKQGFSTYVIGYWELQQSGSGSFLESNLTTRLDRLVPVELISGRVKHTTASQYAVDIDVKDSENPNGVKVSGLNESAIF